MMKIKFYISIFLILIFGGNIRSQTVYKTHILKENIKTLQTKVNGDPLSAPIIMLNSDDVLTISFDEMSHEGHRFSYEIKHCDVDWTISSLSNSEYLQGFSRGYIEDYALSVNTTFLYTNYRFSIPNNDVKFNVSGNYMVNIYEDNDSDHPVASVRIYVVDPKVEIQGVVRGNTDTELYKSLQQVDFDVLTKNYRIQDAHSEIQVVVRQNERTDNEVTGIKPTYYSAGKLSYVNNRNLIFEGGNEYNRFDFSSRYNFDERIKSIEYVRPHYEVTLAANYVRSNQPYQTDFDVNGKFVINYQNGFDDDVEAEYMYVHLFLPVDNPFPTGKIYLGGNWNYNQLDETSLMNFDSYNNLYSKTLLLKQGGYNYQFWFVPENSKKVTVKPIDGSYWQTQNEYTVFVYHRPWGGRYDQLIGVHVL